MAEAQADLMLASGRLAQSLDLPAELVSSLTPMTNKPQMRPLLQLESIARLVKAAADVVDKYVAAEKEPDKDDTEAAGNGVIKGYW